MQYDKHGNTFQFYCPIYFVVAQYDILPDTPVHIQIKHIYIYIYIYIPNMYLESYMSRVLDIPKYRANKDKDKINLVYLWINLMK
jgi:hypothetical protein